MTEMRQMWLNGGKGVLVAALVFGAALAFLGGTFIWSTLPAQQDERPLSVHLPQKVLSQNLRVGEFITIQTTWCNNTGTDISASFSASWSQGGTGEGEILKTIPAANSTAIWETGCNEFRYVAPLAGIDGKPLPPGTWRRSGYVEMSNGDRVSYYSEAFEVQP